MQSKAMEMLDNHAQNKIVIDQFVLQKMIRKCNSESQM